MNTKSMRLFVAIPIDQRWREQLTEHSTLLKSNLPFQKWTHPEDYHITMKFLGDTSIGQLQKIEKLLVKVAENSNPFEIKGKGWGTFGSQASPSILWAGVGGDLNSLRNLHQRIEDSLAKLFPKENREFNPHLTVARRYNGQEPLKTSIEEYLPAASEPNINCSVNEIKLYQSHLQKIPMYEPIISYKFGINL